MSTRRLRRLKFCAGPLRGTVSLTVGILIEFQVDSQTQQQHERDAARSFVLPDVSGNSVGSADLVTVIGGIDG